jgi:hypothetical protein
MRAYVLVETDPETSPIARLLQAVPGVLFAQDIGAPYDALALARSDPSGQTLRRTLDEIRRVPGVIRALAAPLTHSSTGVRGGEAA